MLSRNALPYCALALISGVVGAAEVGVPTTDLVVDTSVRNEVVAFWNRYYLASEGFEERVGWTGSYGGVCDPGETSTAFHADLERRINFFRAMAGIEASVLMNTGSNVAIDSGDPYQPSASTSKEAAAQNAALMFSYAGDITHNPPPASPYACWTTAAWNASDRSNLALGLYGPDAIDGYMRENDPVTLSSWSDTVGHRRWILMQGATDFASGDVPGYPGFYQSSNVLYVRQALAEYEGYTPRFVAWPSEGYFPDELMPTQWSLSYPGADFSSATVVLSDDSGNVPVTIIDRTSVGQGDPSIVWEVPAAVAVPSVTDDTSYQVTVNGIQIGGQTVSHSYEVIVMDPDRIPESLALTGTEQPPSSGANYCFTPVVANEGYRFVVTRSEPANWTEGGETGDLILDGTSAAYSLRGSNAFGAQSFRRTGSYSFRLAFPSLLEDDPQSFILDREINSSNGAQILYYARRGYMQVNTVLKVQVSNDDLNWTTIGTLQGGPGNGFDDSSFVQRSADVPDDFGPYKIRFELSHPAGTAINTVDQGANFAIGVFIDDITVTQSEWVISSVENDCPPEAADARLDQTTAGESLTNGTQYGLRMIAELGGRDYPAGELKVVTVGSALTGYDLWEDAEYPMLTGGFDGDDDGDGIGNGVEYAFSTNPEIPTPRSSLVPDSVAVRLKLQQPVGALKPDVTYQVEWSDDLSVWSAAGSSVVESGGVLEGSVPLGSGSRFIRWTIVRP